MNGTNDPKGLDTSAVANNPHAHHAKLADAYEKYSMDSRFDATKRADAAKFATQERQRADEINFLSSVAFVSQSDGDSKKLTFNEVKTLDLNNDGFITQDEVGTRKSQLPTFIKPPAPPPAKPGAPSELKPGEVDLTGLQKTLYQIDNAKRTGEVTTEMIQKTILTSEKKIGILKEIANDPILGKEFAGPDSVTDELKKQGTTLKNSQFLLKDFNQFAPQDAMQLMKDLQNPDPATLKNIGIKGSTISADDLKLVAGRDGNSKTISPGDLGLPTPTSGSPPTSGPGSTTPTPSPADLQLLDLMKRRDQMFNAVNGLQKDPNAVKLLDSLGELMGRGNKDGKFSDFGLFDLAKMNPDDMMWKALQVNSNGPQLSIEERTRLISFAKTITQVQTDEDNIALLTGENRGQNMVFDPGDIQRWLETHKYWQLPTVTGPG